MDLKTYFQLFWVPAVASAALLLLLCLRDELSRRVRWFVAGWFVAALAAQASGRPSGIVWVAGLVLQTALAVFLLLKHQAEQL